MSAFYDDADRLDAYDLVERFWPYDGPYSDELTVAATTVIERLGRYLNNATSKAGGLPYAAVVSRVLADLRETVAGYEQLLAQLGRFLDHEADSNPSLYDDRYDRPGAVTARLTVTALTEARRSVVGLSDALAEPARLASHLGSE